MARSVDVLNGNDQHRGFNMVTGAHLTKAHPSLANGCSPVAIADSQTTTLSSPNGVTGSPGAVLGTGMNVDLITPGIEAV
jgi:hypothetical protein